MIIEKSKPWLVPDSIIFIDSIINEGSLILEAGAGASTIWFAKRAASVLSFEHDKDWFNSVKETLEHHGIGNVDLRLSPDYPKKGLDIKGMFNVILIDGRGRVKTTMSILKNLKPGGYLILDNAERTKYNPIIKAMKSLEYPAAIFKEKWITAIWRKI